MTADVTVVGAGLIALSAAAELSNRGVSVRLIGTSHSGEASPAAAGMLTPAVESELREVYDLAAAARDRYPSYLDALAERTGITVPLNRLGALRVAANEAAADELRQNRLPEEEWLDRAQVAGLEPAIDANHGALLSTHDGCVDPIALIEALRVFVAHDPNIEIVRENACDIDVSSDTCEVETDQAGRYVSSQVVLAAGAWSPGIRRSGTRLPVEPVRGQIVTYAAAPVRHVTYGPLGYLVPRHDGQTLAGSTFERSGFIAATTDEGLAAVRANAETLCPALAQSQIGSSWAGLRPVTPDLLPILGRDPESPNVIFATGHSRNGILLAPFTAEAVADLATYSVPRYDLGRFRPDRF